MSFDLKALSSNFIAYNNFSFAHVSYAALKNALATHDTTNAEQMASVSVPAVTVFCAVVTARLTVQARAQAQAQAWQNVVNSYMQRAAELHARNKAQAEAHVAEFKADAQKAQADLKAKVDDLSKAGQASWAAMSQALDNSRNAFSKAIEVTAKRFDEAAKG